MAKIDKEEPVNSGSDSDPASKNNGGSAVNRRQVLGFLAQFGAAALLACSSGSKGKSGTPNCTDISQEPEITTTEELLDRLFNNPQINPPEGEYNETKIQQWCDRYTGKDKKYEEAVRKFLARKKRPIVMPREALIQGWERMKESGDLMMVYKKCREHGIPCDVAFLSLAESHWKGTARSYVGAGGYWQFMPKTAVGYGLKIDPEKGVDDRCDVEKSTDAAIRLLKDLYKMTYVWEGKDTKCIDYRDSRRWAWAFWAYNRSPNAVRKDFDALDGDADEYAEHLSDRIKESSGYVSKIFGIRAALAEYEKKRTGKKEVTTIPKSPDAMPKPLEPAAPYVAAFDSPADVLLNNYLSEASHGSAADSLERLNEIRATYLLELKAGAHPKEYIAGALEFVDAEVLEVKQSHRGLFDQVVTVDGVSMGVNLDERCELEVTITTTGPEARLPKKEKHKEKNDDEREEVQTAKYTIKKGDSLFAIANSLCGNPAKYEAARQLIIKMNPQLKNPDHVRGGQHIDVPGKIIKLKRPTKIDVLCAKYYPHVAPAIAANYIRELNGIPGGEREINRGKRLLLPAL